MIHNLHHRLRTLVDQGIISSTNAYLIASRVPISDQLIFKEDAQNLNKGALRTRIQDHYHGTL